MKNLRDFIMESYETNDFVAEKAYEVDEKTKKEIIKFIDDNYTYTGELEIKIGVSMDYENACSVSAPKSGFITVKNKNIKHLTNGKFYWQNIRSNFDCSGCKKLEDLNGAPQIVPGNFNCSDCVKLEELQGGPELVKGNYDCSGCKSLISTLGPKRIEGNFIIKGCDFPKFPKDLIPSFTQVMGKIID